MGKATRRRLRRPLNGGARAASGADPDYASGGDASGMTAVASISTRARSSIRAATCTAVIAGKCRPMTSR